MAYTVEEIKARESKTTKAGKPFTKYLLSLVGEGDVPFADFQNLNPQPGQTLEGFEIKDEGFGKELRKVGGNGRKPMGRSPADTKAIQRQHSQEMALRYLTLKAQIGVVKEDFTMEQLGKIIDWFEKDIAS